MFPPSGDGDQVEGEEGEAIARARAIGDQPVDRSRAMI